MYLIIYWFLFYFFIIIIIFFFYIELLQFHNLSRSSVIMWFVLIWRACNTYCQSPKNRCFPLTKFYFPSFPLPFVYFSIIIIISSSSSSSK